MSTATFQMSDSGTALNIHSTGTGFRPTTGVLMNGRNIAMVNTTSEVRRNEICRAAETLGHAYVVDTTPAQGENDRASYTVTVYTDGKPAPTGFTSDADIEAEVNRRSDAWTAELEKRVEELRDDRNDLLAKLANARAYASFLTQEGCHMRIDQRLNRSAKAHQLQVLLDQHNIDWIHRSKEYGREVFKVYFTDGENVAVITDDPNPDVVTAEPFAYSPR